jgi:predicted porin
MAAVTGAMAQATISGVIDQAYYTSKVTSSAGVSSTTKGIGAQNNGTSEFTISGAEDLGDGMKASFAFNMQADIDTTAGAPVMRRSHIGLQGGFGSIKLGNQWTPAFFVALAADPTRLVSSTSAGLVGATKSVGVSSNSITYDLPSFVPGLAVQLQKGQGDETAGSIAGQNTGGSLTYTSGPFMAAYGWQKLTAGTTPAATTFTTAAGAATANLTSLATLTSGTSKIASTLTSVSYDLGVAKASILNSSDKVTGTTAKTSGTGFGVSIPVGAKTTIGLISSSTNSTSSSSVTYKEKGTRYAVFHNLSKRTTAYAFSGKSSLSGATTGHSMTAVGLQHGF